MTGIADNISRQRSPEQADLGTLQFKGLANIDLSAIASLLKAAGIDPDAGIAGSSDVRSNLRTRMIAAASRLASNDEHIALCLFGLSDEAYSWGPQRRHSQVEKLAGLPWSAYRHGPFAGLCKRILAALSELPTQHPGEPGARTDLEYRLEVLESEYTVPTADDPAVEVLERRRIVAEVDGFKLWRIPVTYISRAVNGDPTIRLIGLGKLSFDPVMLREEEGWGFKAEVIVELPRALLAGESFEFRLRRRIPVDLQLYKEASAPYFWGYALEPRTDMLKLSMHFDPDRVPSQMERQDGVLPSQQFVFGAKHTEAVVLDDSAQVDFEWRSPRARDWYGVIWR